MERRAPRRARAPAVTELQPADAVKRMRRLLAVRAYLELQLQRRRGWGCAVGEAPRQLLRRAGQIDGGSLGTGERGRRGRPDLARLRNGRARNV
jgi:hypothetical protein